MLDWSLLSGPVPWAAAGAGAAGLAFLLAPRPSARQSSALGSRRWWVRAVPTVVLAAVALTALVAFAVDRVWRPFPDPVPLPVLVAFGVALTGAGLAVAGFRRRRWPGRVGSVVAAALVVLAAGQSVNAVYGEYPTLRTALGLPAADQIPFTAVPPRLSLVGARSGQPLDAVWRPPDGMPATGVVTQVDIPATASGFAARPGWLYLPPAYLSSPRAELPVLVLLSGQPGTPRDWLDGGQLAARLDAFAAVHDGLAPVVVLPDDLGSTLANPLCTDSRLGNVATYLGVDVPAWVRATLQVDPDPRAWAVGGFSNGGTCSLQMAVTSPTVYPTFVDLSGEAEPTLGDRASTVQAAFGGGPSAFAAFAAVNPLDVLARTSFPDTAGYLVAGQQDGTYLPQAQGVFAACRAAGMDVALHVLPGGHTWQVWGPGLDEALSWLAPRLGMVS